MQLSGISIIILLCVVLVRGLDGPIRYDNYGVYKLKYSSSWQRNLLLKLTEEHDNFRLWHESKDELHMMVGPKAIWKFQQVLQKTHVKSDLFIKNVQELIENETDISTRADTSEFGWTRYNTLEEIEKWLDEILSAYPEVTEEFIVGQSYENRTIRGIKISYNTGNPGVFIESNIHAREWITSATATWLINQFLTSEDEMIRSLAENHDWYIVPVLNVDGFVYSHEKDRMWRKTRQPSDKSSCIGVDPNRNFDSHWMENGGASDEPCDETYGGPYANSEPEIKAISEYVASIKDKLNVMLAFHSYSQLLLSPYGHTEEEEPENYDDLNEVAKAYADAVLALPYGTSYNYGSVASVLYVASGGTNDWAYNEQNISISYTIEFRDQGKYGFILPPAYIVPNAEEALIGISALLDKCQELNYLELKYTL
ncbi:zinc carboxypeptidase [Drosophila tropicalis]|uniref:zinc carboxypeptidase n=1 Tax=Drosophila tropicalis TaxID=46794 RepID=UPI0035ABB05D